MILSSHRATIRRILAVLAALCFVSLHILPATAGVSAHTRPSDLHLYHQMIKTLAPLLWCVLLLRVAIRPGVFAFLLAGCSLLASYWVVEWSALYHVVASPLMLLADMELILALLAFTLAIFLWGSERITFSIILSTDLLTGLYNRRFFSDRVASAITEQGESTISVIMVRINRFWAYNQHWGTTEGDKALKEMARCLVVNMHQDDLCCRYATTTFAVMIKGISEQALQSRVRWIENRVEQLDLTDMGRRLGLQVTVTGRSLRPGESGLAFLHRVEATLIPDLHGEFLDFQENRPAMHSIAAEL